MAACGGGGRARPPLADRVCDAAARAASRDLHRVATMRLTSADPADITCQLTVGHGRLDVVDQPSPQAWAEYDTTEVHQAQAYGAGAASDPREIPRTVLDGSTGQAGWIPAQRELFGTDATESRGGSYVTATAVGRPAGPAGGREEIGLARAVALAAFAAGPAHAAIVAPT